MFVRPSIAAGLLTAMSSFCCLSSACAQSAAAAQSSQLVSVDEPHLVAQVGHSDPVTSLEFSQDNKWLLTGSYDKTAKLWDIATGRELLTFRGHSLAVNSVGFSPDGQLIVTGSSDGSARTWKANTGEVVHHFYGHSSNVSSVQFSLDGKSVVTGSSDKTARLWDAVTGEESRRFEGHGGEISAVALSNDGKFMLTGSKDNTARLWDTATGKEIRTFEGHSGSVHSACFSPDGNQVLTGSMDGTARLWNAMTGAEVRSFEEPWYEKMYDMAEPFRCVRFSPDGNSILTATKVGEVRIWDAATGKKRQTLEGDSVDAVVCVAYSSDGKLIAAGDWNAGIYIWDAATSKRFGTLKRETNRSGLLTVSADGNRLLTGYQLWDLPTGRPIQVFTGQQEIWLSAAFSPNWKYLVSGTEGSTARLFDSDTGREIQRFWAGGSILREETTVAYSPDGKWVLTGSLDGIARLWDPVTGKKGRTFESNLDIESVAFSPDGKRLCAAGSYVGGRGGAVLWDVSTGAEILSLEQPRRTVSIFYSVGFSPNGEKIVFGTSENIARIFDTTTGKELQTLVGHTDSVWSAIFSSDGERVLTGSFDGTARLWAATTGKEINNYSGHDSAVHSVAFLSDERFVITGSFDGTARLWNLDTGAELCRIINFEDGTWAIIDAAGRFDASNGGNVQGLHWVVATEPLDLIQLKSRYYQPGLLAKIMGFNKEPLRDVSAFTDPKLFPEVALLEPTQAKPVLGINLKNRGGGIGRVVVKINGKELSADARRPGSNPSAESLALEIDLRNDPRLKPGEPNEIEVQAFESENYLRSRGVKVLYEPPGEKDTTPPELWAIVAGVSDYRGDVIDLRYAAKDAEDFATGLSVAAQRLFGVSKVHLTTLSTLQKDPASQPTRTQLVSALEAARQAKPGDILVIYLAGHGVNYGGQDGDFYFLTSDASTAELTDPEVRRETALSSNELTEYVKQIPALKQVLILDTCAAGRLVEKLTEKRDVPSSQIRALERVKDSTGLHVLAGCASDSVSYEATSYGQGLLTHSLLLGMRGAALRDDEYVDISKLFSFAADQVPQLAKDVGGIQRPVIAAPKGTSFDIGRVADDDKAKIPLQSVRPMILRSNFQDEDEIDDILGLGKKVDDALREVSVRGVQSPLVFVDAKEFPEAYRLAGRYRLDGEMVIVDGRLLRGQEKPIKFTITGEKTRLQELAEKLRNAAVQSLDNGH